MGFKTQEKGDIGKAQVIADLSKKGYSICLPISEHLPFDLIAINSKGVVKKVQAKYREVHKGSVSVKLANPYSNSKGCHLIKHDFNWIDMYAIYCPDSNKIYYVEPKNIKAKTMLYLRVTQPKQRTSLKRLVWAKDFEDVSKIF